MMGLYFVDVWRLFDVLGWFVDKGNLVFVVEYYFDVIKVFDWLIDLGLEGGSGGGEVIVCGIFEEVV